MGQLQGTDAEHPASGEVIVETNTVRFINTTITEAPDAQVWLTKNFNKPSGVKLGDLQSFTGDQTYNVPAEVVAAEYDSVVIWCDEFSVPIGKATL